MDNGILVPLADMLNHSRPRQSTWEFNENEDAFIITAVTKLYAGDQVMDSYGRRDNRRFFFTYGFVEDDNMDGNYCSPNTVPIAILHSHPTAMNGLTNPLDGVSQTIEEKSIDEEIDCGFFWNSIVLDTMELVDSGLDKEMEKKKEEIVPDINDTCYGSCISYRSQWLMKNSSVFCASLISLDSDVLYDHSCSQYACLSMCHDDAGTTTIFSIISFFIYINYSFPL